MFDGNIIWKPQSVTIVTPKECIEQSLWTAERMGRLCYNSKSTGDVETRNKFLQSLIKRQHESVIEHIAPISVIFETDRATSLQIVRHRVGFSYSQQSQRYVNAARKGYEFVLPARSDEFDDYKKVFIEAAIKRSCEAYEKLIEDKCNPEDARMVLPNCTLTRIGVTGNLRAWRNFFKLRLDRHAQAEIRLLATSVYDYINKYWPFLVEDLIPDIVEISKYRITAKES